MRARAEQAAEERLLDVLVGPGAQSATRESFRKKLRAGEMEDKAIEIDIADTAGASMIELPGGAGGGMGMMNLSDLLGKALGNRTKRLKTTVAEAREPLANEESDKLLDQESLAKEAVKLAENEGIVFIDEIDKVASRGERAGADISREGVQRDLLPLLEGATVTTKYGPVKTDHVLFIASGAFHVAKPSDLLPELQGRLPIRVELKALTEEDFRRILTEPHASLIKQYIALLATEGVTLKFDDAAIGAIARVAAEVNASIENIGARRLHTVLERLLDEISFAAPDRGGETLEITEAYVTERVGVLAKNADLSRFIL
jgi:ATP-dependent HslUV protease ATP-binding subunit HslU